MGGSLPKVLTPLKGRPMISYVLDAVKKSGVSLKPLIIIGNNAAMVKEALGEEYDYVYQREQLGTGHAVMMCKDMLKGKSQNVIALYGDHPFITSMNIQLLNEIHDRKNAVLTMTTVRIHDFQDWREPFYSFGRIIRDHYGNIEKIVEFKDADEEQKKITEVSPSFFSFQSNWLWENIVKLSNNNAQKEWYLTDLVYMAIQQGQKVVSLPVDPKEAVGINTLEQLKMAEALLV